jgi:glycosyltransferase involved in cell wall biosynthesis
MSQGPRAEIMAEPGRGCRLALVLWNGDVGGAEVLTASLAEHMRRLGATVTIVFIGSPRPLAERLLRAEIQYRSLNLERGRNVLRHPRMYAREIARSGPDGALLVERGFQGATLRAGGYRGPIVAVEHGPLLFEGHVRSRLRRLLRGISRIAGAWAVDAEVAVSDFMLERMRHYAHARRSSRIYNGVDPEAYPAVLPARTGRSAGITVGFAGRLVPGKGADHLIQACAQMGMPDRVRLLIAGDGPERPRLSSLVKTLGIEQRVEFLGVVSDVPALWRRCDIAAVPSDTFIESFSMVTLEAMACGKPIVACRNGAIPELIADGISGTLVTPGSVAELTRALVGYADRPDLRREHGAAARARAIERFHIDTCAQAYIDLFENLQPIDASE